MFDFKFGISAVAKSLMALAEGIGFTVNRDYHAPQVAINYHEWIVIADLKELYLCFSHGMNFTNLKICNSPEEVEKEYLKLLQTIATEEQVYL